MYIIFGRLTGYVLDYDYVYLIYAYILKFRRLLLGGTKQVEIEEQPGE